jgi:hypothetical protein
MAKRQFDYQGYPCAPVNLDENSWFYATKEGVVTCTRTLIGNPAKQVTLPWRLVKRSLDDHERSKKRRGLVGSPKQ